MKGNPITVPPESLAFQKIQEGSRKLWLPCTQCDNGSNFQPKDWVETVLSLPLVLLTSLHVPPMCHA